jgi:hypothetical protein
VLELVNLCSIMIMSKKEQRWLGVGWCPSRGLDLVVEKRETAQKAQQRPFFRELQFIQAALSWLEQSFRSVKFQDEIGI